MYDDDDNHTGAGKAASGDTYEVGWGKPPKHKRYKPGQSGNRGGRPKGSRNKKPFEKGLTAAFSKVANTEILIKEGGQELMVTITEAVVKSAAVAAIKGEGNGRARRDYLGTAERLERAQDAKNEKAQIAAEAEYTERAKSITHYKRSCDAEIERCRAEGRRPPVFLPHPDHIHFDFDNGVITLFGPMTKEEVPEWEATWSLLNKCDERIAEEGKKLDCARSERARKKIRETIVRLEETKIIIRQSSTRVLLAP
jgi:hypothetical protein